MKTHIKPIKAEVAKVTDEGKLIIKFSETLTFPLYISKQFGIKYDTSAPTEDSKARTTKLVVQEKASKKEKRQRRP